MVELIRRRNNHAARDKEVPDLSKVELFPRRNKSERLIPARGITWLFRDRVSRGS